MALVVSVQRKDLFLGIPRLVLHKVRINNPENQVRLTRSYFLLYELEFNAQIADKINKFLANDHYSSRGDNTLIQSSQGISQDGYAFLLRFILIHNNYISFSQAHNSLSLP